MSGHTNPIWSLAKNSADRSNLRNKSDLPAVWTKPFICGPKSDTGQIFWNATSVMLNSFDFYITLDRHSSQFCKLRTLQCQTGQTTCGNPPHLPANKPNSYNTHILRKMGCLKWVSCHESLVKRRWQMLKIAIEMLKFWMKSCFCEVTHVTIPLLPATVITCSQIHWLPLHINL